MITRKNLEELSTEELTLINGLIEDIVRIRQGDNTEEYINIKLPSTAASTGNKIRLIRSLRDATGLGLREAIEAVERKILIQVKKSRSTDYLLTLIEEIKCEMVK
jgi:ribosomal protein L7/L12